MKKTVLILCIIYAAISGNVNSQSISPDNSSDVGKGSEIIPAQKVFTSPSAATNHERWYNYGGTMDEYLFYYSGTNSSLYANYLFPDSTILVNYGVSGYGGTWIHNLADILDVNSQFFNNQMIHPNTMYLTSASSYSVDSIAFNFIYKRNHPNPAIVDTLVFEVAITNSLVNSFFLNPVAANLGVDTVFFKSIPYTFTSNTLNVVNKQVFSVPINATTFADSSSSGIHMVSISTASLPVASAGQLVLSSVRFVPGYSWIANVDTIDRKNSVRFISYKENPGYFPMYVKRDFNASYLVPVSVRYNTSTSGWNGRFIPSFAYMGTAPTYNYEHHLLSYKVSCVSNCGLVSVSESQDGFLLGDAFPNPASGDEVMIPVNVFDSRKSKFTITDILGREFVNIDLSGYPKGVNNLSIHTGNLKSGIYLYSVEDGNTKTTKRFSMIK